MENIMLQLKQTYSFDKWNRQFNNSSILYMPAMINLRKKNMKLMRSCAPMKVVGAYETEWMDTEKSSTRFKLTVIPFENVEKADEQVISRLLYVSILLPRIDDGADEEVISFGDYENILVGRIRNVYWSIQNCGTNKIDLSEIQNELVMSIKARKQKRV